MSFNKRFSTKEHIISNYKNGGIDAVKNYLLKPDALFLTGEDQEFQKNVLNALQSGCILKAQLLINNAIK